MTSSDIVSFTHSRSPRGCSVVRTQTSFPYPAAAIVVAVVAAAVASVAAASVAVAAVPMSSSLQSACFRSTEECLARCASGLVH